MGQGAQALGHVPEPIVHGVDIAVVVSDFPKLGVARPVQEFSNLQWSSKYCSRPTTSGSPEG